MTTELVEKLESAHQAAQDFDAKKRRMEQKEKEAKAAITSFATEIVGKKVVVKEVAFPNFWPRKKGQGWFGGPWPGEGNYGHSPYSESTVQGKTDIEGEVTHCGVSDISPSFIMMEILTDRYYYRATLTAEHIKHMKVR